MTASRAMRFVLLAASLATLAHGSVLQKRALAAPKSLEPNWDYLGCYTDVGRTLDKASGSLEDMTNEKCADFCYDKGFRYAGTEYFHECWCGSALAKGARKVDNAEECSTPCGGDDTQPCGGPDRLTVYLSKGPVLNPGVGDWTASGCYSFELGEHALRQAENSVPYGELTVAKCINACEKAGFNFAGMEYGGECYCANSIRESAVLVDDGCDMPCTGNKTREQCGGSNHMNVYEFDVKELTSTTSFETVSSTTVTSSTSTSISTSTSTTEATTESTTSKSTTSPSTIPEADTTTAAEPETTPSTAATEAETTTSTTSIDEEEPTNEPTDEPSPIPEADTTTTAEPETTPSTTATEAETTTSTTSIDEEEPTDEPTDEPETTEPEDTSSFEADTTAATTESETETTTAEPDSTTTALATSDDDAATTTTAEPGTTTEAPETTTEPANSTVDIDAEETSTTSEEPVETEEPEVCPDQPKSVAAWNWYGCYTEGTSMRALPEKATTSYSMTLEMCATFCSGFKYFGTEWSIECYCSNTFSAGSVKAPAADCNMPCSGEECDYCGASNRLSVYTRGAGPADPDPVNPDPVDPVDPEPEEPEESEGPSLQPTDLPEGWDAYGCWVDQVNGRILNRQVTPEDSELTLASCASACKKLGFSVAGAQYYTQCFCGNAIVNGGEPATSNSQCNTPCGGDNTEICGGPNRMSILSVGEPKVLLPPAPVQQVGDWAYQGCATDTVGDVRTFPWQLIFEDTMTPKQCLDSCAEFGYMAAGLEYGVECYCGDPSDLAKAGSTFVDDDECNVVCAGDPQAYCGGGARMSTYFYEGDEPFYVFNYAEEGTPAAGSYDHLVGGVCIPLITSQGINGKITFVEKWGTGPPNSTGAYELDLTLVGEPDNAMWRPMHLLTDVFCAAGVTLPDKAGRQLTVGGWSGDSTFGVRLYSPDGSPGNPSTNDWEENVDFLSLQDGRWYPSTLNLANGSVLVVGGEDGSNGAPVPTIEVLPYTGTAPIYMDWLERTDPNNLYPFLAVLPSGGIFVSYWNEARILDEDSLDTIKMLPDMPGAVNDPMGGRTYPLEGTAVLLPQRAPYTDLGILVCGGSTVGIANALDNCITIHPDAAEPEWVLERMPSPRVMSCMAPLPDGTYVIMNGAQQGVAGFGLASKPNLNALLYDPSKPVHHRITVMANTTVARMYHSEAITLLDGRVLVSGSDPQDGQNPQEYRVETFTPPYLLTGKPRPTFTLRNRDWNYGQTVTFSLGAAARNGDIEVSLLGSVSSTHGNSMGARTIFPDISCAGQSCTVTAPPGKYVCPPGWYQFFVLDGGIPAVGVFVRIGGDPAETGNWPEGDDFTRPGL